MNILKYPILEDVIHSETHEHIQIIKDEYGSIWALPTLSITDKYTIYPNNFIEIKTNITIGDIYTHYKCGDKYKVLMFARLITTNEAFIIYEAQYGDKLVWARPLNMWNDIILPDKITDFGQGIRFKLEYKKSKDTMKQCITSNQLKELSPDQFRKLCLLIGDEYHFNVSDDYILKNFQKEHLTQYNSILERTNIGKCIEILKGFDKRCHIPIISHNYYDQIDYYDIGLYTKNGYIATSHFTDGIPCEELIDALWELIIKLL